ncbi:uncharacterized protein [Aristolochia californica]|uniref:uncharacterized protein n=1 Tax=Aristolochia californica TaxID=171875 RepID=UPI0035DB8231
MTTGVETKGSKKPGCRNMSTSRVAWFKAFQTSNRRAYRRRRSVELGKLQFRSNIAFTIQGFLQPELSARGRKELLSQITACTSDGGLKPLSDFETGRKLLQEGNVSDPVKLEDDTARVDPLDNLNKTATGVVLGGSSRFHSRGRTVKNIVLDTAYDASETIYNVTTVIRTMPERLVLFDASGRLNSTADRLDREAANIQRQANKNRRWVNLGLTIMYVSTTVIISLNLIVVLALPIFGFLRKNKLFYLLITLCWVLTALCWMYFGAYFFLEKFAGDTCTAVEDYRTDPSNSSLSSILPCDDLVSAQPALQDIKAEIYDLINQVNSNLSAQPESSLLRQFRICNPFSGSPDYIYQPENCPANTIRIGDIPQIINSFTCSGNESGTCIPADTYDEVLAYTTAVQNLLDAFPGMESLVNCQLVNDAINEILFNQCKPVKKFVRMVWVALVALSTIMVILILIWTTKAYHDRLKYSDGSVKPQSATTDTSDESEMSTLDAETLKAKPHV